jgi:hypothetical protein
MLIAFSIGCVWWIDPPMSIADLSTESLRLLACPTANLLRFVRRVK